MHAFLSTCPCVCVCVCVCESHASYEELMGLFPHHDIRLVCIDVDPGTGVRQKK